MNEQIDLTGRRILVTGADSDIGQELVRAFRQKGARVAMHSNAPNDVEADVRIVAAVADRGGCAGVVDEAVSRLDGLDILVNAADIRAEATLEQVTPEIWEEGLAGAKQAMFCIQQAVPELIRSEGSIVNITSTLGRMAGASGTSVPSAAAGAVEQLTQMSALRWGRDGVRVNCVAVGSVAGADGRARSVGYDDAIPLGRLAKADDIVGPVLFLVSGFARHVTGSVLVCDGGTFSGH